MPSGTDDLPETSVDLIAESIEAQEFVNGVMADLDRFKLFPDEYFARVIGNVLSGTSVDKQGESAQMADLEALVAKVDTGEFWVRREHDPLIHPIGRVLAAKMFCAPRRNVHFVVGVVGFYDGNRLPSFSSIGIDISSLPASEATIPYSPQDVRAFVEFNPYEIPSSTVSDMMRAAPACVERSVAEQFRKSELSLAVLHVSGSIWLLSQTPFGKKLQEQLGEKVADASVEFLKWIAGTVTETLRQLTGRDSRLVVSFLYRGCEIEFVLKGTEGPVLTVDAMQTMEAAANESLLLVDALASAVPRRVTYGFDAASKRWFPLHASTRNKGIITNQPYLIALENLHGGLSVGGRRLPIGGNDTEAR
ncbi:MAG: hypothetical protein WBE13_03525 [Candidatus Acidiferrum sp.]